MNKEVLVVGAGLAGSEAAWQIASQGLKVRLVEMRPLKQTPAHRTGLLLNWCAATHCDPMHWRMRWGC